MASKTTAAALAACILSAPAWSQTAPYGYVPMPYGYTAGTPEPALIPIPMPAYPSPPAQALPQAPLPPDPIRPLSNPPVRIPHVLIAPDGSFVVKSPIGDPYSSRPSSPAAPGIQVEPLAPPAPPDPIRRPETEGGREAAFLDSLLAKASRSLGAVLTDRLEGAADDLSEMEGPLPPEALAAEIMLLEEIRDGDLLSGGEDSGLILHLDLLYDRQDRAKSKKAKGR